MPEPTPAKDIPRLKALRKVWSAAISQVDRHAEKCKKCYARVLDEKTARATGALASIDPTTPCSTAEKLWAEERAAMQAFMNAGGHLLAGEDWR